ncbi:MAG: hypothetical protein AB1473_03000 [Thermodesulfobacteriota bacterium]
MDDYREAVLVMAPNGRADRVRSWLEQRDLTVVPIQAGFLLTGSTKVFSKAFHSDAQKLTGPAKLPIPDDLTEDVLSIEIPRPRHLMKKP